MAKREPPNGGKYFGPSGFDPSSGKWGAAVGTPQEVELHARNERERHGLHLLVADEHGLAVAVVAGDHASCCHGGCPPCRRDASRHPAPGRGASESLQSGELHGPGGAQVGLPLCRDRNQHALAGAVEARARSRARSPLPTRAGVDTKSARHRAPRRRGAGWSRSTRGGRGPAHRRLYLGHHRLPLLSRLMHHGPSHQHDQSYRGLRQTR